MSWKMHSLGTRKYSEDVADAVKPILESYGYTWSFASSNATTGVISGNTPNGETYEVGVIGQNYGYYKYYLYVNDATWEFVVTMYDTSKSAIDNLGFVLCSALLKGIGMDTGEEAFFTPSYGGGTTGAGNITNMWNSTPPSGNIGLQKAVFFARSGVNNNGFVSNLFWGSADLAPGVVVTVGANSFLCLSRQLYLKL